MYIFGCIYGCEHKPRKMDVAAASIDISEREIQYYTYEWRKRESLRPGAKS